MKYEDYNIDELLADVEKLIGEEPAQPVAEPEVPAVEEPKVYSDAPEKDASPKTSKKKKSKKKKKKKSKLRRFFTGLGKFLLVLLETVLLLVVLLYGVMYVLAKGPSPTARDLFVMSVRETSAMKWVANLYFTDEEIAMIESGGEEDQVEEYVETDTSLITITKPTEAPGGQEQDGPVADEWGFVDEDGDGIIIDKVTGEGYVGYMMIVQDPSRVILGTVPDSYGHRGYTVAEMVEKFDAVAGINAGGFEDPGGHGNGSTPSTMTVFEGKIYYDYKGIQDGFVGFDSNNVMHVGKFTAQDVKDKDIQYGVAFGPVLVVNGEAADRSKLASGINPRTAIGQRSDGAVLMLVVDGRQAISLGCTWLDMVDIFLEYGAVNACNLDGGSSTLMWYQGDYINNCASVVGIRPVPTTFLVMKEGAVDNG